MAGIRIGTLYTENRDLVEALAKLGPFHGISGTTQHQVARLLQDRGMDPRVTCFCTHNVKKKKSHFFSLFAQSKQFVGLSWNSWMQMSLNGSFSTMSVCCRETSSLFSASFEMTGALHGASAARHAAQRLVRFNLHSPIVTSRCHALDWINKDFLPENRCRLKAAHSYLTGELRGMGVPYLDRPAALYVWADLRKVTRWWGWCFSSHLYIANSNTDSLLKLLL